MEVPSEGLSSPCSPLSYVAGTCCGFLRAAGRSQARSLGQQAEPACSGWLSCWCEGFVLSQAGCLGRVWGLEQELWAGLSSSTSVSSRTGGSGRSSGHRRAVRHGPSGEPTCCAGVGPRGSASWQRLAQPRCSSSRVFLVFPPFLLLAPRHTCARAASPPAGLAARGEAPGCFCVCDRVLRHSEVWFVQSRAAGRA